MTHTSRRRFAKSLVAAAAALPALAQTPAAAVVPPSALGRALTELTRAQYGQHLHGDDLARMEKDFQDSVPVLERFRGFKLTNADEPDVTFGALVDRW